jgi:hypothetical protein
VRPGYLVITIEPAATECSCGIANVAHRILKRINCDIIQFFKDFFNVSFQENQEFAFGEHYKFHKSSFVFKNINKSLHTGTQAQTNNIVS